MQAKGVAPSLHTYTTMIHMYATHNRKDSMLKMWKEMNEKKFTAEAELYTTVITALSGMGDFDAMLSILNEMRSKSVKKDIVFAYNAVLSAFGQVSDLDKLEHHFKLMVTDGVLPDTATYNIIIEAYGQQAHLRTVQQRFKDMKDAGIKPNIKTYTSIMNSFANFGDVTNTLKYYNEMKDAGIKPDLLTYVVLMDAHGAAADYAEMSRYYREMKQNIVVEQKHSYHRIMRTCAKHGWGEGVIDTFEWLKQRKDFPVEYDSYLHLMDSLALLQDTYNMIKYVGEMAANNVKHSGPRVFVTVLQALAEKRDTKNMAKYMEEMHAQGQRHYPSFDLFIRTLGSQLDVANMWKYYESMKAIYKPEPSLYAFVHTFASPTAKEPKGAVANK